MTNQDLFRIFFAEQTPTQGLRAVFEAGKQAEREGSDDITRAADDFRSLQGNYATRGSNVQN